MLEIIYSGFIVLLTILLLILIIFGVYSVRENEKQAAFKVIPIFLFSGIILVAQCLHFIPESVQLAGLSSGILICITLFIPFGNKTIKYQIPKKKYDERDIMFSRMELEPGSKNHTNYYKKHPKNLEKDILFRKEPGLLSPESKFYNEYIFNAAQATFSAVDLLHPLVDVNKPVEITNRTDKKEITTFIRNWAIRLGAHSVGFTLLKEHHVYSVAGRGKKYGEKISSEHKYAIAFTVEMNHEFVNSAPRGTIIMESSQQYFNAGQIAIQIAQFLRSLGYNARAHIDANYQVICPIVAQDAGLGTIGRMGLLITPKLGPRVRIGVITTDFEPELSKNTLDSSVVQFCNICKKCSSNCPSQAIPKTSSKTLNDRAPWKIDHEKCFTYWTKVGTDCGKCMAVCPYSHPDNLIHNLMRFLIRRNSFNRWIALTLDDYFYGIKPVSKKMRKWLLTAPN